MVSGYLWVYWWIAVGGVVSGYLWVVDEYLCVELVGTWCVVSGYLWVITGWIPVRLLVGRCGWWGSGGVGQWGSGYLWAGGEVLHEHAGQLGEVGGAARAGDVLVVRAAQHGVQRMPHLVEQVVDSGGRQQRGPAAVPAAQRQHHHHYRVLGHTHTQQLK